MSVEAQKSTAYFYLVDAERWNEVVCAAEPPKKHFLCFSWRDYSAPSGLFAYLNASARPLEPYVYSGLVFRDLDQILAQYSGACLEQFSSSSRTRAIWGPHDYEYVLVFESGGAEKGVASLEAVHAGFEFSQGQHALANQVSSSAEELRRTREHLVGWLSLVRENKVGILVLS